MRTDSHELAASTTTRALIRRSAPVTLSTKATPVALPASSIVTSRTIALERMSRLPVASAGGRCTVGDW